MNSFNNMNKKTFAPKKEEVIRKWYLIDVKGKVVGKVATKISELLRGKGKTIFSRSVDCGDFVIVLNAKDVVLTGNKVEAKLYRHHSGYMGGLSETSAKRMLEKKPEYVLMHAVKGMIPNNNLRDEIMKKLKIYTGAEHPHEAQQPEVIEL